MKCANLILYYVIFLIVFALKFIETFPRQSDNLTIISIIFDVISFFMHLILAIKDPGYIKNEGIDFLKLLESFEPSSLCPEC